MQQQVLAVRQQMNPTKSRLVVCLTVGLGFLSCALRADAQAGHQDSIVTFWHERTVRDVADEPLSVRRRHHK